MTDDFIINTKKPHVNPSVTVRMDDDAAELLAIIQSECGISARNIVSDMIRFAAARVKYKGRDGLSESRF